MLLRINMTLLQVHGYPAVPAHPGPLPAPGSSGKSSTITNFQKTLFCFVDVMKYADQQETEQRATHQPDIF